MVIETKQDMDGCWQRRRTTPRVLYCDAMLNEDEDESALTRTEWYLCTLILLLWVLLFTTRGRKCFVLLLVVASARFFIVTAAVLFLSVASRQRTMATSELFLLNFYAHFSYMIRVTCCFDICSSSHLPFTCEFFYEFGCAYITLSR